MRAFERWPAIIVVQPEWNKTLPPIKFLLLLKGNPLVISVDSCRFTSFIIPAKVRQLTQAFLRSAFVFAFRCMESIVSVNIFLRAVSAPANYNNPHKTLDVCWFLVFHRCRLFDWSVLFPKIRLHQVLGKKGRGQDLPSFLCK